MGRIAVKDFRDLTKSRVCHVIFECGEPRFRLSPRWLTSTMHLYMYAVRNGPVNHGQTVP